MEAVMVNIRQKGFNAEREMATLLNGLVMAVMRELGFPEDAILKASTTIQRNQNQSAVGGSDLSNTFGLAIEVKRHEDTSGINGWWKQCCAAAERNGELPVLLYRQSRSKWRCQTLVQLDCPIGDGRMVRAEFDYETFQLWFKDWIRVKLRQGEAIRT
jgi:hypothetical protein